MATVFGRTLIGGTAQNDRSESSDSSCVPVSRLAHCGTYQVE